MLRPLGLAGLLLDATAWGTVEGVTGRAAGCELADAINKMSVSLIDQATLRFAIDHYRALGDRQRSRRIALASSCVSTNPEDGN